MRIYWHALWRWTREVRTSRIVAKVEIMSLAAQAFHYILVKISCSPLVSHF